MVIVVLGHGGHARLRAGAAGQGAEVHHAVDEELRGGRVAVALAVGDDAVAQAQLDRPGLAAHLTKIGEGKHVGVAQRGHVDGEVLDEEALRDVHQVADIGAGRGAVEAPHKIEGGVARVEPDRTLDDGLVEVRECALQSEKPTVSRRTQSRTSRSHAQKPAVDAGSNQRN